MYYGPLAFYFLKPVLMSMVLALGGSLLTLSLCRSAEDILMFVVLVAVLAAASSVDDAVAGTAVFVIENVFSKLNPNSAASLWYINIPNI